MALFYCFKNFVLFLFNAGPILMTFFILFWALLSGGVGMRKEIKKFNFP